MGCRVVYGSNPRNLRTARCSGFHGISGIKTWLFRIFVMTRSCIVNKIKTQDLFMNRKIRRLSRKTNF